MSNEETEEKLQLKINKGFGKLRYYVEDGNETMKEGNFNKINIISN